jgi:hypothetical protein
MNGKLAWTHQCWLWLLGLYMGMGRPGLGPDVTGAASQSGAFVSQGAWHVPARFNMLERPRWGSSSLALGCHNTTWRLLTRAAQPDAWTVGRAWSDSYGTAQAGRLCTDTLPWTSLPGRSQATAAGLMRQPTLPWHLTRTYQSAASDNATHAWTQPPDGSGLHWILMLTALPGLHTGRAQGWPGLSQTQLADSRGCQVNDLYTEGT